MKKNIAIKVENLGKQYKIGKQEEYSNLRDKLANIVKLLSQIIKGKKTLKKNNIWALKNVSFEVKKGEVLGIIGPNGAGKSTLLKILSRITEPTEGKAELRGRISSLLEVGTGFHSELTGRENIYLNGVILGMTKREVNKKFNKIIEFSGVKKFLDTPIKHYSSGMKVRLAFSVAAHLKSEILLVDEVLSVGDATFQKKSFDKMEEVTKRSNRTILFVSHDMGAIKSLCQKCILLDKGSIKKVGKTEDVTNSYLEQHMKRVQQKFPINLRYFSRKRGGDQLKMNYLDIESNKGNITSGKDLAIRIGLEKKQKAVINDAVVGIVCINSRGQPCFMLRSDIYKRRLSIPQKRGYIKIVISELPLAEGFYTLDIQIFSLCGSHQGTYDWIEMGNINFYVQPGDFYKTGHPGFPESASMLVQSEWDIFSS